MDLIIVCLAQKLDLDPNSEAPVAHEVGWKKVRGSVAEIRGSNPIRICFKDIGMCRTQKTKIKEEVKLANLIRIKCYVFMQIQPVCIYTRKLVRASRRVRKVEFFA